jgi:AcrR family transcriptional regulator
MALPKKPSLRKAVAARHGGLARKEKVPQIRQDILDAAAKVFGSRGYERATLEEVAEIVGIQKGSLYYHIESKEQLLLEIHNRLNNEAFRRIDAAIARAKGDPSTELKEIIHAIVDLISTNQDRCRVVLRDYRSITPKNTAVVLQHRAEFLGVIEGVIKRVLLASGRGRSVRPRLAAQGILGMTFWVTEWLNKNTDSAEEIADVFSAIVLNGLGSRR